MLHQGLKTCTTSQQEFDGAARSAKSIAGVGAVLFDDSTGQQIAVLRQKLDHVNNNQAEAAALLLGMEVH